MYCASEEMGAFLEMARQVSRKTYQERLLNAGIPETPEFLNELQELANADSVRAFILSIGTEPIAYLCSPARNGVLIYDHLGYAPEYADWSPGTVLQFLAFESLFTEQRFGCFDFTEGEGPHKKLFSTHKKTCSDLYVFALRPSMLLLISVHYVLGRVVAGCFRVADILKLRGRIRQWLRR
jgi:CelD/BcsL family acetyltransferase involved in cellulose biosynthesis